MIAERCRRDELPPGLLPRIEHCFETDFDGEAHRLTEL